MNPPVLLDVFGFNALYRDGGIIKRITNTSMSSIDPNTSSNILNILNEAELEAPVHVISYILYEDSWHITWLQMIDDVPKIGFAMTEGHQMDKQDSLVVVDNVLYRFAFDGRQISTKTLKNTYMRINGRVKMPKARIHERCGNDIWEIDDEQERLIEPIDIIRIVGHHSHYILEASHRYCSGLLKDTRSGDYVDYRLYNAPWWIEVIIVSELGIHYYACDWEKKVASEILLIPHKRPIIEITRNHFIDSKGLIWVFTKHGAAKAGKLEYPVDNRPKSSKCPQI